MDARPLLDAAGQFTPDPPLHPTTPTRWWILFIYALISMCQSCTWNIFGPIYPATYRAFPSWSGSYLSWVINSANIAFAVMLYPFSVGVKRWGPRRVTLFSASMVFLCTALRCIPLSDGPLQRAVVVVSMLCNGCGGPWLNFGAPIISELWFPSHERTMATAIATVAVYAGGAIGFVIGPAVVGCAADDSGDSICTETEGEQHMHELRNYAVRSTRRHVTPHATPRVTRS